MAERTVKLRIGADISGLQSQMRAAQASVADFSKKSVSYIEKNSASITDLSNRVGAVGLGLTTLATIAVTRFAQFDKAMSSAQAATRATGAELASLREAAIDAGADTAFSAAEAAKGIEELAKAGVGTKDILGGGLTGALNLAAAGELEVAEAAEIAATAITQFKLEGADVGHVADVLAAGAGKAQGGVQDMALALKYAGVPLAQLGVSFEETSGAVALFAKNGILGEQAGTSLRSIVSSLTSPSAAAAAEMKKLGINVFDAQDEFIGMEGVAGQLESRLGVLTEKERAASLGRIFGNESLQAANVLYDQGAAGIAKWTAAVDDQGFAAEQARIQTDNLIGDVERLGGSLDAVFIQAGSGANDGLRGIVQTAESVVDAIGEIPGPVLNATTLIAGGGGLALLGIAGLGKLTVGFAEARDAAKALGISAKTAGILAGGVGAALAVGTVAIAAWAQSAADARAAVDGWKTTLDEFGNTTDATLQGINDKLSQSHDVWYKFGEDQRSAIQIAEDYGVAIEDVQQAILGNEDAFDRVQASLGKYGETVAAYSPQAETFQDASSLLNSTISQQRDEIAKATTETERKAAADEAAGVATGDLAAATEDTTSATEALTVALEENWQAQLDASGAVLSLRDAQNQAEAAFDDARQALEDNGKTLDVTTEKGRANRSALDQIASAGWDVVDSMRENGASQGALQKTMGTTRKRFIDVATSMGMGKEQARALADQLGLIPKNVEPKVKVVDNATPTIAEIRSDLASLQDKTVRVSVVTSAVGGGSGVRFTGAGGSGVQLKADGGPIPMVPGAVAGQDSVPILGMPGEHMLTVADVQAMGGQAGVYAFRQALHMAEGGAVGQAGRDVTMWRRELERARDQARRARDAERKAGRTDSERDDRAAERAMAAAEKRVDRANKALDEALSRRGRLLEESSDLRTSLRRGDLRDQVTGGVSGAYSAVDQLRSLADSGDLGRGRSQRLRGLAGNAEKALRGLYAQAERVEGKLADATDRFEELQQVQAGVQSNIVGGFGLSDVRGDTFDPATGKRVASASALAAAAKTYASKAKKFPGLLSSLWKKSGSAAIVQEVAGYGVEEGSLLAQSLLADLPSLRSLAASYEDISRYGGQAGAAVALAVGGGKGLWDAQQAVNAAQAQADAIDKRIGNWAKRIGQETAKALGVKPRALGGDMMPGNAYVTGEFGRELVLPQRPGYVLTADATRRLAYASGTSTASGGSSTTYNDNSLSVVTNKEVSDRTLLRFDKKRTMLRGRP